MVTKPVRIQAIAMNRCLNARDAVTGQGTMALGLIHWRAVLPVPLLSGHSATVDVTSTRALEIRALLATPIDSAALQGAIDAALH